MDKAGLCFPLSFPQQRLWFLDQLVPGNPFYNLPMAIPMRLALNLPALEWSLGEIVRRHEVLRTTFAMHDGEPVQVVSSSSSVTLRLDDLRPLAPDERQSMVLRRAAEEARSPFDLGRGPLFRVALLRLEDSDYLLLLTLHHIVFDGWSFDVFWRELEALYTAACTRRPPSLPPLHVQYGDFAVWQRDWLQGEVLEQQMAYWTEQLADLPRLELPTDRMRPAVWTYRGSQAEVRVPAKVAAGLKACGSDVRATPFMVLLAAFEVLLLRYTGQEDVVVGLPVANRTRPEFENLIGFFVNSLVLRTRLAGRMTFRALLARVREIALGAYSHQDLPFEKLVEELHPERDLSRNPLFQVTFQLLALPSRRDMGGDPDPLLLKAQRGSAIFDLALNLWPHGQDFRGLLEYNTDLFDPVTAKRMASHFETLLAAVVENPESPLSDLSLLSAAEEHQIRREWNDTASGGDAPAVHRLVAAWAARTPDAPAVVSQGQRLTFAELDRRANQLAWSLLGRGVGPESLVGILLERSAEMILAALGVLKAGGGYVPLDPVLPDERLAAMMEDARLQAVVTVERFAERLAGRVPRVLVLDGDPDAREIAGESSAAPPDRALPENLAYVLFTSGSTGRPKGVAVEHHSLANLAAWYREACRVTREDRASQAAAVGFDAAVWEVWSHLAAGAAIYVIDDATRLSPAALLEWLYANGITLCFLPTPLAETVLEEPSLGSLELRALLTGGDRLTRRPATDQGPRLVNLYGPTEATVITTWAEISAHRWPEVLPPIGRPIANARVYVLDRDLHPVPIGVEGELYVSGGGLARGYVGRPDLTAGLFLPNPFASEPGARLYRSGDRVRALPDGELEFLGRIDRQVKLRGFRLEPGEIEALLARHPAVRLAVVAVREDRPGEQRLVAYVVPTEDGGRGMETELRRYLERHLPAAVVPSAFVWLDALPVTAHGKLDAAALPAPEGSGGERTDRYMAPRSSVEEVLAGVWADVLGRDLVGVDDHLFNDLGGHSLLVSQIAARVRDLFGVELPLQAVFAAPTVAGCGAALLASEPERIETTAALLLEVQRLPQEEVERLLATGGAA